MLRNEFIHKDEKTFAEHFDFRLQIFQQYGEIEISPRTKEISLSDSTRKSLKEQVMPRKRNFSYVDYFYQMGLYLVDTYLCALLAVTEMLAGNHTLREESLIQNLHGAII